MSSIFGIDYFLTKKEVTVVMVSRKLKRTQICFWYLAFVYTFTAAYEIYNFKGKVIESTNTPAIEFTCKTSQRPIGDSIVFLLDDRTTNVMRVYGGKCYDNHGECKNCTCLLDHNNITFTWIYTMTVPCHSCTFGADMSFRNEGKIRNVNLYMIYNCKELGPFQTETQVVHHDTAQGEDMNDGFTIPLIICIIATVLCLIITIAVLRRKKIRSCTEQPEEITGADEELLASIASKEEKTDTDKELLTNTDENESGCCAKSTLVSVKLSRKIMLKDKSDHICGIVSVSKNRFAVAYDYNNTLKIYCDDQFEFKHFLLYKITGVTCISKDVIAVTLVNNANLVLFKIENRKLNQLQTIEVGHNLFGITSDKNRLLFGQKDVGAKLVMFKIYSDTLQEMQAINHNGDFTYGVSKKLALDMISETVYLCDKDTEQVLALNFKGCEKWNMPISKPTEIVIVQDSAKSRKILVLCKNKNENEMFCVSKDGFHRVYEEGETIRKSSIFKYMTYNAELNQLFVQTDINVINVYSITHRSKSQ